MPFPVKNKEDALLCKCPKCVREMQLGFTLRAYGLWYIPAKQVGNVVIKEKDLVKAGWRRFFPSKAEFYRAHLCEACKVFAVEYSESLTQQEDARLSGGKN